MMTNSKELFHDLVSRITLSEDPSEIHSIVYLVLEKKLGLSRTEVMAGKQVPTMDWQPVVDRINRHEPVQYILEEAWFFGRPFYVNSFVLVPRPETELLVIEVKKHLAQQADKKKLHIMDACTGSGCIAITLALEIKHAKLTATDLSRGALAVARKNAQHHSVLVDFLRHDLLTQPLDFSMDIIVSNPPYISQAEKKEMKENVLRYEPALALFAPPDDPLAFYRALARLGKAALSPNGIIFAEINEHFGKETAAVFSEAGFNTDTLQDLDGKNRILKAY